MCELGGGGDGDAQGGWNLRNDCLGLVGLLMQTQVKAAGGSHNEHSVARAWLEFSVILFPIQEGERQSFPNLCI